jgi:hypothetical protein
MPGPQRRSSLPVRCNVFPVATLTPAAGSGLPRLRPQPIKKRPLLISNRNASGSSLAHNSFELDIMMLIKLNDKGVRVYMACSRTHYRTAQDWQARIGRIEKYSRNRSIAYVVWSGNRSCDRVPIRLIEPTTLENRSPASPF